MIENDSRVQQECVRSVTCLKIDKTLEATKSSDSYLIITKFYMGWQVAIIAFI